MKKISIAIIMSIIALTVWKANASHYTANNKPLTDTLKKDGIDPTCKMKIKAGSTKTVVHNKIVYGFCSESCKQKFIKEPNKYIKK